MKKGRKVGKMTHYLFLNKVNVVFNYKHRRVTKIKGVGLVTKSSK